MPDMKEFQKAVKKMEAVQKKFVGLQADLNKALGDIGREQGQAAAYLAAAPTAPAMFGKYQQSLLKIAKLQDKVNTISISMGKAEDEMQKAAKEVGKIADAAGKK